MSKAPWYSKPMTRITTPSRLHFTLIDLNASLGRVDGGVGLALEEPSIEITAEEGKGLVVIGQSEHIARIRSSAEKLLPKGEGIEIKIVRDYPSHLGLGSGTQASLAAGMAVNMLFDLGLSVREIALRVGRGGTSGIGIAAFEYGGFILDGGHRYSEKKAFSPSSASKAPPPPLLLHRDFPDWDIVLAIPNLKGASGEREVDIFQKECPIPLQEVQALSHIILMEMLPSLVEEDIEAFGDAINRIQEVGFKKREVALAGGEVKRIVEIMRTNGAWGAGLSSFGPTVYGITDVPEDVKKAVQEFLGEKGGRVLATRARNRGAGIETIN